MDLNKDKKTLPPRPPQGALFVPLEFWLDVISYLDKRVEIASHLSGYGMVEMSLKFLNGRIYEVNFGERVKVRELIEKAGERGLPNQHQSKSSVSTDEEKPIL